MHALRRSAKLFSVVEPVAIVGQRLDDLCRFARASSPVPWPQVSGVNATGIAVQLRTKAEGARVGPPAV